MGIEHEAEKEMKRLEEIFSSLKVLDKEKAKEFYEFAKNYFEDGKHFFEQEKFIQAFEAFVIAWSYIDAGIKLDFFEVTEELKKHFTS
jgi:hypothetical protein